MKPIKLQKLLICSAIALTLPALATTNPVQEGTNLPFYPDGSATPKPNSEIPDLATPPYFPEQPNSGSSNPATSGGQGEIKDKNDESTGGLKNPNGASGDKPADTIPVENGSIKDAVADCPLEEVRQEAIKEAIRINDIMPNIDKMFDPDNEASSGCFAASDKIINLAMEIPSVSFSLTGIGDLVKKNLEKILMQKAEELLAKGCEIANEAILQSLEPLQEYLDEYDERVGDFNGMIGNIELGEGVVGGGFGGGFGGTYKDTADFIRDKISGTKIDIAAAAKSMLEIDKAILEKYKNAMSEDLIVGGGFGGSTGSGGGTGTGTGGSTGSGGGTGTGTGGSTGTGNGGTGGTGTGAAGNAGNGGTIGDGSSSPSARQMPQPASSAPSSNPFGASSAPSSNPFGASSQSSSANSSF